MKLFVSNWDQVYKSLAVWLPILGTGLYQFLQTVYSSGQIPDNLNTPIVAILGALGWVINQPGIRVGGRND